MNPIANRRRTRHLVFAMMLFISVVTKRERERAPKKFVLYLGVQFICVFLCVRMKEEEFWSVLFCINAAKRVVVVVVVVIIIITVYFCCSNNEASSFPSSSSTI